MLVSVVSLCVMVYNYHTRPKVSNVLWYANVKGYFNHCSTCYRTGYDETVNQGRKSCNDRHEARLLEAIGCSL